MFGGYWNRPVENAEAFLDRDGGRWYNTGDVVRVGRRGGLHLLGRRDRMVKRRGYRIELGEIERALYRHPQMREAAVVSVPDRGRGREDRRVPLLPGGAAPSIIELKTFCASSCPPT